MAETKPSKVSLGSLQDAIKSGAPKRDLYRILSDVVHQRDGEGQVDQKLHRRMTDRIVEQGINTIFKVRGKGKK